MQALTTEAILTALLSISVSASWTTWKRESTARAGGRAALSLVFVYYGYSGASSFVAARSAGSMPHLLFAAMAIVAVVVGMALLLAVCSVADVIVSKERNKSHEGSSRLIEGPIWILLPASALVPYFLGIVPYLPTR